MIKLELTADTTEEFHQQLAAILAGKSLTFSAVTGGGGGGGVIDAPLADPPKATRKKSEPQPAADTSTAESPATEAGPAPAEAEAGEPGALTYDADIKPAVLKVSGKHGREGVIKLLEPYGVQNAKDIPADKWPELLATVAGLLED